MEMSLIEDRKTRARAWFEALRNDICAAFERLEDDAPASLYPGDAGIERGRGVVFQPFEGRADVVAQGFEPGSCARLAIFDQRHIHSEFPTLLFVIASEATCPP